MNSLPEASLEDLGEEKFGLLFLATKFEVEKELLVFLKQKTIFHRSLVSVIVDKSHKEKTWSGKSSINNFSELLL